MVSITPGYERREARRFSWPAKGELAILGMTAAAITFGAYALLNNYVRHQVKDRPVAAAAFVDTSIFTKAFGLATTLHQQAYQPYFDRWLPHGTFAVVHRAEFDWIVKEAQEKLPTKGLVRTHVTFQSASQIATGSLDLSQWVILCAAENDHHAAADIDLLPREALNVKRFRDEITGKTPVSGTRVNKIKRCDALGYSSIFPN
jgi:hypothetical protein